MDLPVTLRDLARRVDVRVPILPPPGLAPALHAAADELERMAGKVAAQQAAVNEITERAAARGKELEAVVLRAVEARRRADGATRDAEAAQGVADRMRFEMADRIARLKAMVTETQERAEAVTGMQSRAAAMLVELGRVAPMIEASGALLTQLQPFIAAAAAVQKIMEGQKV